ncbi:MAG TPA: SRPBCC family protein [Candidatus Nitrosotenuis sp.]|nr:SRPBCC family protein [Candidatus Nitrosotenuis sp.]
MATIEASTIVNVPVDKVWDLISDIDNEPKFWKGTKEIRNISKEGNTVTREVTIAFKDSKCMQTVTLFPKEKIVGQFTKGVLNGTKTISILAQDDKTKIDAVWDIKLSGMMGMFTGMIKKHIQSGTEQALESIKQELEK